MSTSHLPPVIALGTAQWGLSYGIANQDGQATRDEVEAILTRAKDAGITIIDTAQAYGNAEEVVGSLASEERWRVITKLSPNIWERGLSSDKVVWRVWEGVDESHELLERPCIDTLLLHRPAHRTCCGGAIWRALIEMREAGEIQRLGISAVNPQDALDALDDPDVEVMQVAASLLDQRLLRAGFFEEAAARGKEIHIRSVFLQGVAFLDPSALPKHLSGLQGALTKIKNWGRARDLSSSEVFLAFARSWPVAALVLGAEKLWQLDANLSAYERVGDLSLDGLDLLAKDLSGLDETLINPALWS